MANPLHRPAYMRQTDENFERHQALRAQEGFISCQDYAANLSRHSNASTDYAKQVDFLTHVAACNNFKMKN